MPRTVEDVERYLLELGRSFENDHGTYLLDAGADHPPIALRLAPPILALRVMIGAAPVASGPPVALYRKLLEYNASDLVHASYGLEGDEIVLSSALELENLDQNELEAAIADFDLALARHVPTLREASRR